MKSIYLLPALLMSAGSLTTLAQEPGDTVPEPEVSINLDDFVVTAQKEVIKSDGAKLTYDVSEDESAKGQTLLDALKKVPMVTVDAQDNIQINGNSGFKIYVNGKEDVMMEANYQKIFKAMPAESVKKIEVLTEPGAKYDAEGFGGILNLITETQQRRDGYSGTLAAGYGTKQGYLSAYGTVKADKVMVSLNLTGAMDGFMPNKNINESETEYLHSETDRRLVTNGRQKFNFGYESVGLNMSWEPSSRHLFTMGGSFNNVNAKVKEFTNSNIMFDAAGNRRWSYDLNVDKGKIWNQGASANASYRIGFNDMSTHRIIFAYMFDYGKNFMDITTNTTNGDNYPILTPWQDITNHEYTRQHTVQADYSNPFGDGNHTLDAGFKGIFRRNTAISGLLVGDSKENMLPQDNDNDNINQNMDIYAGYLAYNGSFAGKFGLTAGIRYEHTAMNLVYHDKTKTGFSSHLNDWVPNAALTYIFGPATNLRLAYQMRISRPSLSQVNPYELKFSDQDINKGNPDLTSERNNVVSLTYTNFGRLLGGNIKLSYEQTDNSIISYTRYEGIAAIHTYGNYGLRRMVGLSGFLNWNITNAMSLSVNGSVRYTDINARKINQRSHGWGGNYGINWNYSAPKGFKFNVGGGQNIHEITAQGYNTGYYYYGLGVNKTFLKDNSLNVGLSAWNFLRAYQGGSWHTNTPDTRSVARWSQWSPSVALTLSWNFGHLKDKVKESGLNINPDDTSTTKGKSSISM